MRWRAISTRRLGERSVTSSPASAPLLLELNGTLYDDDAASNICRALNVDSNIGSGAVKPAVNNWPTRERGTGGERVTAGGSSAAAPPAQRLPSPQRERGDLREKERKLDLRIQQRVEKETWGEGGPVPAGGEAWGEGGPALEWGEEGGPDLEWEGEGGPKAGAYTRPLLSST